MSMVMTALTTLDVTAEGLYKIIDESHTIYLWCIGTTWFYELHRHGTPFVLHGIEQDLPVVLGGIRERRQR